MGGTVKDMGRLFPRYARDIYIRATHDRNTINKWLSESLGIQKTTHSLRHSMKDLLRDAGISEEVSKQLLGHGSRSISDQYGSGFTLPGLRKMRRRASPAASLRNKRGFSHGLQNLRNANSRPL